MEEISDSGKVWLKGRVKPVVAVRMSEVILIPGFEEDDEIEFWGDKGRLCVDVHSVRQNIRIARLFSPGLEGTVPGTLFSGFTQTKHADILAVLPDGDGVQELRFEGADYRDVADLDRDVFWKRAALDPESREKF